MPSIKGATDLRLWHEAVAMVPRDQIVPIGLGGQTNEANLAGVAYVCGWVVGLCTCLSCVCVCIVCACVCMCVCVRVVFACVCLCFFFNVLALCIPVF